ncbi:MAG: hypothetical protein K1X42_09165 [Opitutaceae bacterium]|nr:hypothetical protein [Opitutaceae bacterium]
MFTTLNLRALGVAAIATLALTGAILVGSRNLQNFDGALIAYLFGAVFAWFGLVYRYDVWLQRPPTRLYWKRGWQFFFSGRMFGHGWALVRRGFEDMAAQRFIRKRGGLRWAGHMLIAWGCVIAFAVTFPLTFGWIHFTLAHGTIDTYEAHVFGFRLFSFPLNSFIAANIFHVLNWSSVMIIVGLGLMMRRRLTDAGQIAIQTFEGDILPLILLAAIAVTGLGLTWDYEFMQGRAHQFMAITHAIVVILFLLWMPFGKFFHIFQRPAQLGVAIYRREGAMGPQAVCPHTQEAFASQLHIDDLKATTRELGYNFTLEDGSSHLQLSPQGKRAALAKAHLAARRRSGSLFG